MHDWLRRFGREHPVLTDLGVVAVGLVSSWASVFAVAGKVGWAWALLFAIVPAVALLWRRRLPFGVLGLGLASGLTQWAFGVPVNGSHLVLMLGLYSIARFEPARSGRIALGLCLALVAIAPLRQPYQGPGNTLLQSLFVVLVWVLGTNVALRQQYLRNLEERAARLERERDAAVHTATLTERTRIAREMHDVVAHHVSVMVVQAEGATWAIDTAPDQARTAVVTIAETGRSTLTELRRMLGVLRGSEAKSVAPQPGMADVPDLVEQFRLSGLEVRFGGVPTEAGVAESVQLAVYRVVQEGLTNVLKHAGPGTRVRVEIKSVASEILVEIEDDGGRADSLHSNTDAPGHGLIGIRERAALFGGRTDIGPQTGGFAVRAWFPVNPVKPA